MSVYYTVGFLCSFFPIPTSSFLPPLAKMWRLLMHLITLNDTHTHTHTTVGRAPLDELSARRRPLPDDTQHSQETDIHGAGGIRTRNPSKRAAVYPRLRSRVPSSYHSVYSLEFGCILFQLMHEVNNNKKNTAYFVW